MMGQYDVTGTVDESQHQCKNIILYFDNDVDFVARMKNISISCLEYERSTIPVLYDKTHKRSTFFKRNKAVGSIKTVS